MTSEEEDGAPCGRSAGHAAPVTAILAMFVTHALQRAAQLILLPRWLCKRTRPAT